MVKRPVLRTQIIHRALQTHCGLQHNEYWCQNGVRTTVLLDPNGCNISNLIAYSFTKLHCVLASSCIEGIRTQSDVQQTQARSLLTR